MNNRVIGKVLYGINVCISSYVWYIRTSADKEIKAAEKLIARYQTARMGSKGGLGQDKSPLVEKLDEAYNAFVVGVTSYNSQDAAIRAHSLRAKAANKRITSAIVVQMVCNIVTSILIGKAWKTPLIVMIAATTLLLNQDQQAMLTHISSMICSTNIVSICVEGAFASMTYVRVVPAKYKWIAGAIYSLTSIISLFL